MANRYWVGGTGNWNDTTHWSDTSSGATGFSVPTSGDSAYFDVNSFGATSTVTVNATASCLDMNWSGITQNVTFSNASYNLNVYGNLILYPGLTWSFTSSSYLYFKSSSTKNLTTNGVTVSCVNVAVDAGTLIHQDNCNFNNADMSVSNATWNTNDKTIYISRLMGGTSRTLNLGASKIYVKRTWIGNQISLTAGTSEITFNGSEVNFGGAGNYYDLTIYVSNYSPNINSYGTLSFNNLKIYSTTFTNFNFLANFTVNGTLTMNGSNATTRLYITGNGSQRTITASNVSAQYLDLNYIKGTGVTSDIWNLSGITGRSRDLGNNSGILFSPALNLYWYRGTGNWSDTTKWFTQTNGGGTNGYLPFSTDDVYFDQNSFIGTSTITVNVTANCLDMNWSGITQNVTFSNAAYSLNVYGNLTLWTGLTWTFTATGYLYFKSTTTGNTITTNNVILNGNGIYFNGVGGSWSNLDDANFGTSSYYLTNGIWDTSGFTIRTTGVYNHGIGTKTLTLGSSTFYVASFMTETNAAGWTFNCGTSQLVVSNLFQGSSKIYYSLTFSGGTGYYLYGASVNCTNMSIIGGSSLFVYYGDQLISNILTIQGISSTNRLLVYSSTLGSIKSFICNGSVIASNVDFRDIQGAGTASWNLSGITGGAGNCGGNSGIVFLNQTLYWYQGSGSWTNTTKWFLQSNGVNPANRFPLVQETVIFDENSFSGGTSNISVDVAKIGNIIATGVTQLVNLNLTTNLDYLNRSYLCVAFYGNNLSLSSGITIVGTGFDTYSPLTIRFNVKSLFKTTINMARPVTYIFDNDFSSNSSMNSLSVFIGGGAIVDFNGYNTNINYFDFRGPTVYLRNGTHITTGGIMRSAVGGTSTMVIRCTSNTSFYTDGSTFNNLIIDCASKRCTLSMDFSYSTTIINNFTILPGNTIIYGSLGTNYITNLTAIGTSTSGITISGLTSFTLTKSGSSISEARYLTIYNSTATPINKWYAGYGSINGGNNSGWIFGTLPNVPIQMNLFVYKNYNRVLTDAEVLQNFNALKTRFGL